MPIAKEHTPPLPPSFTAGLHTEPSPWSGGSLRRLPVHVGAVFPALCVALGTPPLSVPWLPHLYSDYNSPCPKVILGGVNEMSTGTVMSLLAPMRTMRGGHAGLSTCALHT